MDARVHIFIAMALGRDKVASPMRHLYSWKNPCTHFTAVEWTPGLIRTWKSKKKSPPLWHPRLNPGHPAHSQAPCHLSSLGICTDSINHTMHQVHLRMKNISKVYSTQYRNATVIILNVIYWEARSSNSFRIKNIISTGIFIGFIVLSLLKLEACYQSKFRI